VREKTRTMLRSLDQVVNSSGERSKKLESSPTIATSPTSPSADPPTTELPPKPKLRPALKSTSPVKSKQSGPITFSVSATLRWRRSQGTQVSPNIVVSYINSAWEPSSRRFTLPMFFARLNMVLHSVVTWKGSLVLYEERQHPQEPPQEPSSSPDKAGLKWLLRKLDEAPVISFDLETSSVGSGKNLRYHQPWDEDGRIVMAGFSWGPGMGAAVPLHHAESPWSDPDKVLRLFKRALEAREKKTIAHNGKFDCKWLASRGIFVKLTFDTMLAAHMLDENRLKALESLAQIIFGVDSWKQGGEITKDAYNAPLKQLARYQAKDVDYTLRLYYRFKDEFKQNPRLARLMAWLVMPASDALVHVETVGQYVIDEHLKEQTAHYEKVREKLERKMLKYVPKEKRPTFNFRSTKQVPQWLFGDLGLNPVKKTKTGADSTDEHVLLTLKDDHPVVPLLLRYRTVDMKYLRTYLTKWEEWRDSRSRIHTNYKLYGTVTNRLSSEKPNLQQVPRESTLRTCFGAPVGWHFVEADYAQVELRIAAMLSGDPTLLRIFHTGGDPHLATAAEIAGLTPDEVKASDATGKTEHRKRAKPVNFGFLYGMGEAKFIDYAFDNYGVTVTEQEAHVYRERYFRLYSRLLAWHDRQRRLANRYGRVVSPLGRVRHLPDIGSSDAKVRAEAERQAINSPVQVTASDLMLLSLVRLVNEFRPSVARVVGTVHDSLLFEIKDGYVDEHVARIREVMERETIREVKKKFGADIDVPITVDFKIGQYWGAK
jgi:DNA polymerase I-like protein with 3'-5' exonuclease and polymerase domains